MTLSFGFALGVGLFAIYLGILSWNLFFAATSFTSRTRLDRFPFGRCLVAAAGPTLLPVVVFLVLAWWGYKDLVIGLTFMTSWGLSIWGTQQVERRLPGSPPVGERTREVVLEATRGEAPAPLTQAQSCGFMILGVLKAWLSLAIGVVVGYGVAMTVSRMVGLPFHPPTWARLATREPTMMVIFYAMSGVLIEALRFQQDPGNPPRPMTWSAAPGLRLGLLACLAGMGVGVGVYAGLFW